MWLWSGSLAFKKNAKTKCENFQKGPHCIFEKGAQGDFHVGLLEYPPLKVGFVGLTSLFNGTLIEKVFNKKSLKMMLL